MMEEQWTNVSADASNKLKQPIKWYIRKTHQSTKPLIKTRTLGHGFALKEECVDQKQTWQRRLLEKYEILWKET